MGKVKHQPLPLDSTVFLYGIVAVLLSIFIILAPFNEALFYSINVKFEQPIFAWLLYLSFVFLFVATLMYMKRSLIGTRELMLYSLALLLPAEMILSHQTALTRYSSFQLLLIGITLSLLFIAGQTLSKREKFAGAMQKVLLGSSYIIVWFGLLNVAGFAKSIDAVMVTPTATGFDFRATSVFQYANAYAAFLIPAVLGSLYNMVHAKTKLTFAFYGFMLFPAVFSLLLTGSRGGVVILAAGLLALFYFISLPRQLVALGLLALAFLPSFLALDYVTKAAIAIVQTPASSPGTLLLLLFIGVSLLFAFMAWLAKPALFVFMDKPASSRKRSSRYVLMYAPVLIAIVMGGLYFLVFAAFPGLIPEEIQNRLTSLSSFSERAMYYRDTLPMIADHPLLGVGGGGWASAITLYQYYPFQTAQAHSFIVQYVSEYGLLGLLLLLSFMIAVFTIFIKQNRSSADMDEQGPGLTMIYFLFAFSLLLHSLFDFTLSFVYLSAIVFFCLGGMLRLTPDKEGQAASKTSVTIAVLVCSVAAIFTAFQAWQVVHENISFQAVVKVNETGKNPEKTNLFYDQQLSGAKLNPEFVLYKTTLLTQLFNQTKNQRYMEEASALLQALKEREPYRREIWNQQYIVALSKSELEAAFAHEQQSLDVFRWDIRLYEHLVNLGYQLGYTQMKQGVSPAAIAWWDEALRYYRETADKTALLRSFTRSEQVNNFNFAITDLMSLNAGIIYYIRGDYAAAELALKDKINFHPQAEVHKGIDRWYLAAIRKQNRDNESLYQQLILADGKEKQYIQQLLDGNYQ